MKANKYKLKPTPEQIEKLSQNFGCARFIYNFALSRKKELWESEKKNISRFELQSLLVQMKKDENTSWLKNAHSQVLQSSLMHLDNAFKNFFKKKARYPTFKKKYRSQSIQYPQGVSIKENQIYLPKIGLVKAIIHREAIGKIKTVTVSKDATDSYYASVLLDDNKIKPEKKKHIESHIGIDMGIKHFLVSSDRKKIKNPKFADRQLKNLRQKQRKLSNKKRGSIRYKKAKKLVAKIHKKTKDARNDFQHKLSLELASKNQAVSIETLSMLEMSKNRILSRRLADIGWNEFTQKLSYKLEDRGKSLVKIDKFFPSTKTCSCCNHILDNISLSVRNWTCDQCGTKHDRDINASINIDYQGVIKLKAEGFTVSARGGYIRLSHRQQ